ncbi:hypothetical protein HDU83_005938 [Entophlyctis luteolus]|nr:hypothetical protein HDU83_005938 [Entophlyctis luteolus]KAJ3380200.1 hypothetical protein HDU84_006082 [Entophlyctis sp. JEL0112]
MPNLERIAVTGGNGFIAAHIIHQLLTSDYAKYKVTATVRSRQKGDAIYDLPNAKERLSLQIIQNLSQANFAGHHAVLHLAAPNFTDAKNDARLEIVDPAIQGTIAVLRAAKQSETVKVVIVMSSLRAATEGPVVGAKIDETMWNDTSSLKQNPLFYSKVCAERAAWSFMVENPDCNFKLITLLPSLVIGPSLTKALGETNAIIQAIVTGAIPFRVSLSMPIVDVRDVAATFVAAVEYYETVESGRYLVANDHTSSVNEICDWIAVKHSELNKVPTKSASHCVSTLITYTRKPGYGSAMRYSMVPNGVYDGAMGFDITTEKLRNALPALPPFRTVRETIEATVQDMRMWGHI